MPFGPYDHHGEVYDRVEVSAFLSPLVSSMEHQEIALELSDEEHLNGGQCLRKSPGVCIAPCLQG